MPSLNSDVPTSVVRICNLKRPCLGSDACGNEISIFRRCVCNIAFKSGPAGFKDLVVANRTPRTTAISYYESIYTPPIELRGSFGHSFSVRHCDWLIFFFLSFIYLVLSMSHKRSRNSNASRKRSKNGITSSQYTLEDDREPSDSEVDDDYVRTWDLRPAGNGRSGGRRKGAKVTELRCPSPELTRFDFSAPEPEQESSTGDVIVQVPDLLQSKRRRRKQRNDSVFHVSPLDYQPLTQTHADEDDRLVGQRTEHIPR